jgi:hypothetical protein
MSTVDVWVIHGCHRRRAGVPGGARRADPVGWHHVERYANNPIEADHGRLKHRLRAMRGLRTVQTAQVVIAGHAFMQNLRRGHYELGLDTRPGLQVVVAEAGIFLAAAALLARFCFWWTRRRLA